MANIAKIMELYTAYFNRAADKDGVDYWANEMDTKAWTLDDVANSFAQQTGYTALYAGKTNAEIVALVYTNVLNRAADTDGATYWEGQLTNGAVTVSQLIQAVVNAATEKDGSGNYKNATDAAIVNNKTAVSQYAYDSNVNAKNISLAGVTADVASIDAAKASVDAANPANVGETFSLTAGTAGEILVGTTKNDTFVGDKDSIDPADKLVDGSTTDNDTANLSDNGDLDALTIANVENVNVTISNTAAATAQDVDASNFSGVKVLTVTKSDLTVGGSTIAGNKDAVITNVNADNVAKVVLGMATKAATITQTTKAGVEIDASTATGAIAVTGAAKLSANNAESTVALTALGNTTEDGKAVSINAAKATSVTTAALFTGAISINAAAANTIDVDNATGGVTINAEKAAETVTSATGIRVGNIDDSGATIVTGSYAKTTAGLIELEGTSGTTDTATVSAAGYVTLKTNSDTAGTDQIENITLSGNGAAVVYTMTGAPTTTTISGDQDVTLKVATSLLDAKTVTDTSSATSTLEISGAAGADIDLSKVAVDAIKLTGDIATDNGNNELTVATNTNLVIAADQTDISILGKETKSTLNVSTADDTSASGATIDISVGSFAADTNFTTVNVDATVGKFTATSTTLATDTVLNVSGTKDVALGTVVAKEVNASTSTGKVSLNSATTATITTGAGADTLDFDDSNSTTTKFTVVTGAGNDIVRIEDAAVASSFDLGEGNDQITIGSATSTNAAKSYVVVAGAGDDTVTIAHNINSDSILVGGEGSDKLVFADTDGNDFSGNTNFTFNGFETLDISALTSGTIKIANADLNAQTFTLKGNATADRLTVVGTTGADIIDASNITVDTASVILDGGAGADVITGTASDDTIIGGEGADIIDGGAGVDTYVGTQTDADNTGTETGMVINLGTTAVASTAIVGSGVGYTADSVTSVAAGSSTYLFASSESTNGSVIDTLTNIENVIGTAGADYIVAAQGGSTISGEAGNDYIVASANADIIVISDVTSAGVDTIKGFAAGTDKIKFSTVTAVNTDATDLSSHATLAAAVTAIAGATDYSGDATIFTYDSKKYVFINDATRAYAAGSDAVVEITGYTGTLAIGDFIA